MNGESQHYNNYLIKNNGNTHLSTPSRRNCWRIKQYPRLRPLDSHPTSCLPHPSFGYHLCQSQCSQMDRILDHFASFQLHYKASD